FSHSRPSSAAVATLLIPLLCSSIRSSTSTTHGVGVRQRSTDASVKKPTERTAQLFAKSPGTSEMTSGTQTCIGSSSTWSANWSECSGGKIQSPRSNTISTVEDSSMKHLFAFLFLVALAAPQRVVGAIGCTLANPAEDLKYLFPEMTTYKEELNEFPRLKDGSKLFNGLNVRLGSDLDPIYETYETPYTVYSVFKGQTKIGIVHGVNVPGKGGVIQV